MTSPRAKGLKFVREVKEILKRLGHEVEGPGHAVLKLPSGFVPVHSDFFGVFDLISFHPDHGFRFHQVSTDQHRSEKAREIAKKNMNGTVWGRCKMQNRVAYRTYYVAVDGHTEESETYYLK